MRIKIDLETVRTETKIVAIYIVSQRLRDDLPWRRRTGRYGKIVRQNVIDMYKQNKSELKDMIERLNFTAGTRVECFESILNKRLRTKDVIGDASLQPTHSR